jgi:hypothetical protein
MSLSAEDVALLQRIRDGERVFDPPSREAAADPAWLRLVERLLSLRDRGLIRMRDPLRSHMSAAGGYLAAGPCELTGDGYDLLDRLQPPA